MKQKTTDEEIEIQNNINASGCRIILNQVIEKKDAEIKELKEDIAQDNRDLDKVNRKNEEITLQLLIEGNKNLELKSKLEDQENMLNFSKIAFINAVDRNEKDLKEAMRDIITRYGRKESMGGYSTEFLVNWCMQYWTLITHHFRKECDDWKKEQFQNSIQKSEVLKLISQYKCGEHKKLKKQL